jgi:hypothetical protein
MMAYWNLKFKMPFLRYLNRADLQSFTIPSSVYSWIDGNLTASINTFKFDLYDKFGIINISPNYQSTSMIYLFSNYIQSVLPQGPDGKPYSFTQFIESIYEYILENLSQGKSLRNRIQKI